MRRRRRSAERAPTVSRLRRECPWRRIGARWVDMLCLQNCNLSGAIFVTMTFLTIVGDMIEIGCARDAHLTWWKSETANSTRRRFGYLPHASALGLPEADGEERGRLAKPGLLRIPVSHAPTSRAPTLALRGGILEISLDVGSDLDQHVKVGNLLGRRQPL